MAKNTISFKLKNDLSELDRLFEYVERLQGSMGTDRKCTLHCKLALEELFTNIVSYGYPDNKEHWIDFIIFKENDSMVIQIEDDGSYFNPVEMPSPDTDERIEEREAGGLGVHLTKHFIDEMVYKRVEGKNIVILKLSLEQFDCKI